MKTLYLDIFSGISGDMFIGALLDLGLDFHALEHELEKLQLHSYHLHEKRGQKSSIAGTKFDVHLAHEHNHEHSHGEATHKHPHSHHEKAQAHGHQAHEEDHHHHHDNEHEHEHEHHDEHAHGGHEHEHGRTFSEIKELISKSALSSWVKQKSIAIFQRIAVAEGAIHGLPPEQVHFHEVGAVDSIVDIVGACIGLELMGKPRVLSALVVEGTGFIQCAHGRFPIPAPATLAILGNRGISISQTEEPHELVTPTGAALLAELVEDFGPMRGLVAEKIGFGLGTRDNKTRPNVLRAVLGTVSSRPATHDWQSDTISVLEANLDDINPEILGYFVEKALAAGALDVFHTPVQMKKNRPGVLLTVLCADSDSDRFTEMLLRETSTFGVRRHSTERRKLQREFTTVKTQYGEITVKLGKLDGKVLQAAPEYESCKKLSESANIPLKDVYKLAATGINHLQGLAI
ncbi:MAG TPA: nickel pincer cofactor biosynthesis protein LarC [Candidatus Dormibacteraeota bacterium]|nr:nickel pincer cofactor biosynthesis protein LarC [Candidatus Dormibacteraeota bacterium]